MIIRVKKNWKDQIEGKPHAPNEENVSRRDFLKRGIYASSLLVTAPSFFSLLRTDQALAAAFESVYRTVDASYVLYEASGGACFPKMIAPPDEKGAPLVNRNLIGWTNNAGTNNTLISGLTLNTADAFFTTLNDNGGGYNVGGQQRAQACDAGTMRNLLQTHVSGCTVSCATGDDTDANQMLNLHIVQRMRMGSVMKTLGQGGRSANAVFNAASEPARGFNVVNARTVNELIAAVSAEDTRIPAAQRPGVDQTIAGLLSTAIQGLTGIQSPRDYKGSIGRTQFETTLAGGLQKNAAKFDPNYGRNLFDIASQANSARLFGNGEKLNAGYTNGLNGGDLDRERGYVASLSATHRQLGGSMYVENGGYDYHDNTDGSNQRKHAELARFVALWLMTAHAEGKPSMVMFVTDGATSFNNQNGQLVPPGDRGSACMPFMLFYDPKGKREIQRHVGNFTSGRDAEAASRTTVVGRNTRMIGLSGAIAFARFAGLSTSASDRTFKDLALAGGFALSDADLISLSPFG